MNKEMEYNSTKAQCHNGSRHMTLHVNICQNRKWLQSHISHKSTRMIGNQVHPTNLLFAIHETRSTLYLFFPVGISNLAVRSTVFSSTWKFDINDPSKISCHVWYDRFFNQNFSFGLIWHSNNADIIFPIMHGKQSWMNFTAPDFT